MLKYTNLVVAALLTATFTSHTAQDFESPSVSKSLLSWSSLGLGCTTGYYGIKSLYSFMTVLHHEKLELAVNASLSQNYNRQMVTACRNPEKRGRNWEDFKKDDLREKIEDRLLFYNSAGHAIGIDHQNTGNSSTEPDQTERFTEPTEDQLKILKDPTTKSLDEQRQKMNAKINNSKKRCKLAAKKFMIFGSLALTTTVASKLIS